MQVSKAKNIYLLSEQGYFLLCGFGENQKVILAKTIAEIHENRLDKINDLIKNNLSRFNENELIDLKSKPSEGLQFEQLGFTKMQLAKSNNIFLLSYKTKRYTIIAKTPKPSNMPAKNELKPLIKNKNNPLKKQKIKT